MSVMGRFTPEEELELRGLFEQAWQVKLTAPTYLTDACAAIVEWAERRPLRELERRQERHAQAVRLIRETTALLDRCSEAQRAA